MASILAKKNEKRHIGQVLSNEDMKTFGEKLRELRESKGLLLREVCDALDMDTALLSKFERNERNPSKEQVLALSKFYKSNENDFLVEWLSDKIANDLEGETVALRAVQIAQRKIKQFKRRQ